MEWIPTGFDVMPEIKGKADVELPQADCRPMWVLRRWHAARCSLGASRRRKMNWQSATYEIPDKGRCFWLFYVRRNGLEPKVAAIVRRKQKIQRSQILLYVKLLLIRLAHIDAHGERRHRIDSRANDVGERWGIKNLLELMLDENLSTLFLNHQCVP